MSPTEPIDPAEILAALYDAPGVSGALVVERTAADGSPTVVGFVTGPDSATGGAQVRRHLAAALPEYLVPGRIVVLDELPLTADGDYDIDALPVLTEGAAAATDDFVPARTPQEKQIADIMRDILGVDRVGAYDSFFALGGSSIMATQLAKEIREAFVVDVSLLDVLAAPTVEELALLVRESPSIDGTGV
jgi:acyl carrier protein